MARKPIINGGVLFLSRLTLCSLIFDQAEMLAAGQRLCGLCRKHANLHRAARSMCYVNVGPEYTFTDHERRSLEKLWKSRLNEQDSKQATRQVWFICSYYHT